MNFKALVTIFAIATLGGIATFALIYYGNLAPWAFDSSEDDVLRDIAGNSSGPTQKPKLKEGRSLTNSKVQQLVEIPGVGRMPASKAQKLQAWKLELGLGEKGLKRISEMDYRDGSSLFDPWASSQAFLDEFNDYTFRVDRGQLSLNNMQDGSQQNELKKIIYDQNIDGVPVENSRLAFLYADDGTLYEVQASVAEAGDIPANKEPEISPFEAASIASGAIEKRYSRAGHDLPAEFLPSQFAQKAEFRFFLSPTGVVTKRYRFIYLIKPQENLDPGEYEIAVDTVTRTIATDRKISRR